MWFGMGWYLSSHSSQFSFFIVCIFPSFYIPYNPIAHNVKLVACGLLLSTTTGWIFQLQVEFFFRDQIPRRVGSVYIATSIVASIPCPRASGIIAGSLKDGWELNAHSPAYCVLWMNSKLSSHLEPTNRLVDLQESTIAPPSRKNVAALTDPRSLLYSDAVTNNPCKPVRQGCERSGIRRLASPKPLILFVLFRHIPCSF